MASPDTPADRAYVAARLAQMDHQLAQAREAMETTWDTYRDDWTSRHAEQLRAHREHCDAITADQAAWLANWLDGDPDEGRPANVDRQESQEASGRGPATPAGIPAGQLPNPHEAELAEAECIRSMSMQEYAARRAELGVRSPTSMDHLFRQEPPR
jgi:hypothetical protein